MVYLPTFGCFLGQMLVNIPYMEHMGIPLHPLAYHHFHNVDMAIFYGCPHFQTQPSGEKILGLCESVQASDIGSKPDGFSKQHNSTKGKVEGPLGHPICSYVLSVKKTHR